MYESLTAAVLKDENYFYIAILQKFAIHYTIKYW